MRKTTDPTRALTYPKRLRSRGKHADRLTPEQFRDWVWLRDRECDRATGQHLFRSHSDANFRGQVAHLKGRRVRPEWLTDPNHAILLSDSNHQLSDARGGRLLRLTDPETGEPATDGTKPIRFTRIDREGKTLWSRLG